MDKLRVGVIGTGRIGKVHIQNLVNRIKNVEVVAVADIMIEQSKEWLDDIGIEAMYADYKKIVEDPSIDAVFVCSSTDTHSQISYEAIKQGKHVFCEKPIDYDIDRIKMVIDAVEQEKVKFQVGFNKRFDRNYKKLYDAVRAGDVGAPHIIKITSRDPGLPPIEYIKVSGGIFVDMMIHDFDMMRYLSGEEVVEVYAGGSVLIDPAVGKAGDVDTAIVQLKFESGALGVIDNSRQAVYGYDQRAEVFGSKGCIMTKNETPNLTTYYSKDAVTTEKPLYFFLERFNDAYINEASIFIDCVINDKPVPVSAVDGLKPVLIAIAAQKSLDTGKPVKL
jgi:myo-inositol 2-dehydrogenase / D-chiro-inositol 1-dehydrogenase